MRDATASDPPKSRSGSDMVAIIGGGLAGLSAALELACAGCAATVLEARDRVGGRTLTEEHHGVPIDGGGQYVGPRQEAVLSWIRRYGLETCPAYAEGDWLLEVREASFRQRGEWPDLPERDLAQLQEAVVSLEQMAATVPLDAPWQAPRALEWDALSARAWLDRELISAPAREFLCLCMEITLAADAHEASLLHMLFMLSSLGGFASAIWGAQELRVVGGTQALSNAAAKELGAVVRLNSPVRSIQDCGDHVVVSMDGSSDLVAGRAIVALPPPLAARLFYDPPLPPRRDQLCQRMPMGVAMKAVLFYDGPFWRERGLNGLVISSDGPVSWLYDNCWQDPAPAMLVGFVTGRTATELSALPVQARRDAIIDGVARSLGPQAKRAVDYIDWRWAEEVWSRGCYASFATPGAWTSTGSALRAPVGRIHWAGSDTASEWVGFMDGAISSGVRAAREVLAAVTATP